MKKFINSVKRFIFVYLITTIAIIILVSYAFNIKTAPKDSEKIGIVVGKIDANIEKEDFVYPEYIRQFNFSKIDGNLFYYSVEAKESVNNVDVLIINKEQIENLSDLLITLDEEWISLNFGLFNTYKINDEIFGLDVDIINEGIEEENKLYICFVKSSLHLGYINNSGDDAAIYVINNFINK